MMRLKGLGLLLLIASSGCAVFRGARGSEKAIELEAVQITGDLELDKLNDEELFAAATSFFAAEDFTLDARYFGRICAFHPGGRHRRAAPANARTACATVNRREETSMPSPISTALTAPMDMIAEASLASSLSKTGSPIPAGRPVTQHSITPPEES